jgi:hypothetical protein
MLVSFWERYFGPGRGCFWSNFLQLSLSNLGRTCRTKTECAGTLHTSNTFLYTTESGTSQGICTNLECGTHTRPCFIFRVSLGTQIGTGRGGRRKCVLAPCTRAIRSLLPQNPDRPRVCALILSVGPTTGEYKTPHKTLTKNAVSLPHHTTPRTTPSYQTLHTTQKHVHTSCCKSQIP